MPSRHIRVSSRLLAAFFMLAAQPVLAQSSILQGGPWTPGHMPMYSGSGAYQPIAQDAGGAAGGAAGLGLSEFLQVNRATGTGPLGTHSCDYDAPVSSGSYHYLCWDANAQGGGVLAYGAGGTASALPFSLSINGTSYQFPFVLSGIVGPNPSIVGDVPVFSNTAGTAVSDGGPAAFGVTLVSDLRNIPVTSRTSTFTVRAIGYYTAGDMPEATYTLSKSSCSLNGGLGDGGSQFPSATANNCWLLNARSSYDVRLFGANGSATTTTGNINLNSPTLTVASANTFAVNQWVDVYGAGAPFALNNASSVSVTTEGTTGTTHYCMRIVAIDASHGFGPATSEVCATDGNATLQVPDSGTVAQDELVQWTAPVGASTTSYAVYAGPSGAEVCTSVTTQTLWRWYGQGNECPSWLPSSPPSSATADLLRAQITGVSGTTITLSANAGTTVTGASVQHDDTIPIQNALNVETTVYLPCLTFHTTSGLVVGASSGQSLRGANKECATLKSDGTFDVVTLTTPNWSGPPAPFLNSLTAGDFGITANGMASGYATKIFNATRSRLDHITITSAYNELLAQDSFIGEVTNFYSFSRRRGDVGFHLVGSGSGGNLGQQLTNFDFLLVNSASSYQGISFHLNGNIAATRARHFGMQTSPYQMVINNAIGAGQVATYFQGYDVGFNVCWRLCLNIQTGTLAQFFSPYIQQVSAGGANPEAVLLAVVDAVAVPSTGSLGTQFYGGTIFGGDVAIKDNGTGTIISGTNVFTSLGRNAAIECTSSSVGLNVVGGNSYTLTSNLPSGQSNYGVLLDSGCTRPTILGDWLGTVAGVQNNASPSSDVTINGQFNPPPTANFSGGSGTLTVGSQPNLYTGMPGYVPNLEVTGSVGTPTLTTDTAANIVASLTNPYVGQPIWFNVRNHDHNSGTPAVITIAGGAGVTITGTATVPDSGGSGMYSSRMFKGTVTNIGGGTEAITIKGCSTTAGNAC